MKGSFETISHLPSRLSSIEGNQPRNRTTPFAPKPFRPQEMVLEAGELPYDWSFILARLLIHQSHNEVQESATVFVMGLAPLGERGLSK